MDQSPKLDFAKIVSTPAVTLLLLSILIALMLHANWSSPLYRFDDEYHLKPAMKLKVSRWFVLREKSSFPYIPVTYASYVLDLFLFGQDKNQPVGSKVQTGSATVAGENPFSSELRDATPFPIPSAAGMRVMNGLYHLLAGFLLWLFLRRIGAGEGIALIVALVWTGHPMALESVAWISERKNVLAAVFGFGMLLAWTADSERKWRWPLVNFLYVLAILSKPSALGLLPVLAGLEIFRPGFNYQRGGDWGILARRLALPVLLSAVMSYVTMRSVNVEIIDPPGGSVFTALLTDVEIFSRYIVNILLPLNLSFFYGVDPIVSLTDSRLWTHGLLLLAVCAGTVWAAGAKYRLLALLGLFWFFGALGPNANIVGIPFWMQDRYTYLSSAGLLLAVCCAAAGLAQRAQSPSFKLHYAAWLWPVLIAALTFTRSPLFIDSERLILDAAQRQPGSAMARLTAAWVFKQRFHRHSINGSQPNRQLAEASGRAILEMYSGVEKCADLYAHIDPFTLRVQKAEVLPILGRLDEALAELGPVPPPDLPMLPDHGDEGELIIRGRNEKQAGYPPHVLANAWLVLGEVHLRQTALDKPVDERIALSQQALSDAENSIKVSNRDYKGHILKARAQFRLADLHAQKNDMTSAMRFYNDALATLKTVPDTSLSYKSAQQGLAVMTPPKAPAKEPSKEPAP
ncbi:MAG TPA: hypothetical protein VEK08_17985 [Planctomycetota bacterium]|nr:hypothetical protein [Planctomycetota bacterium]